MRLKVGSGSSIRFKILLERIRNMSFSIHPSVKPRLFRLGLLCVLLAGLLSGALLAAAEPDAAAKAKPAVKKIPVILDTDIGDDIDDTWALGLILKSPEIDLKLVVGDQGKVEYRAKLLAKFLQNAGRTDVAVGKGLDVNAKGDGGQAAWVADYNLKSYPGKVHEDGVQAMIDLIMKSPEPVTLLALGPVPNLKVALEREPKIANKVRVVGMYGSVRKGYENKPQPDPEYNVKCDVKACQAVFNAPWEMVITPLDTCGLIRLKGDKYAKVSASKDPIAATIIQNYRIWLKANNKGQDVPPEKESSVLFDTVAVYLVMTQSLCKMEDLKIRVNDEGFTVEDPQGKKMSVATEWKNLAAYEDYLVERLTGGK